jgi:hypothetical protein
MTRRRAGVSVSLLVVLACATLWPGDTAAQETGDLPLPAPPKQEARASVTFPADDVFTPAVADPNEPHFFASVLRVRPQATGQPTTLAAVGFGEEFGLWGQRLEQGGWQVSVQAGVLAQLSLDPATSYALINADYIVGVPLTWRREALSARIRLYHQSSHMGDEYLLLNPTVQRVNLSFEELELVAAYDLTPTGSRAYAGGGFLLKRNPAMRRERLFCGFEWRARRPMRPADVPHLLAATPLVAMELKASAELDWKPSVRLVAGVELARERGQRGLKLLGEYYHGFFPYGQFFRQKIDHFGISVHLAF